MSQTKTQENILNSSKLFFIVVNNLVKKITLDVKDDLWEKFKLLVPRNVKLNDAVVYLIRKAVERGVYDNKS